MEHEGSLPHIKVPATSPYCEPVDITLIKLFNK
jgi:hypothetical protein